MDKKLNQTSLWLGLLGIIIQFFAIIGGASLAGAMKLHTDAAILMVFGILSVGTVLLIAGLSYYARAKNQSGWWGLMGFLGIIGLLVLSMLPDRHADQERIQKITTRIEDLPEEGGVEFHCLGCGYLLNGVVGTTCPECGRAFDPDNLQTVAVHGHQPPTPHWTSRWSLICGIFGTFMFCIPCICQLMSIGGICFGHIALIQARKTPQRLGRGVALAGLVMSYLSLVGGLVWFIYLATNR